MSHTALLFCCCGCLLFSPYKLEQSRHSLGRQDLIPSNYPEFHTCIFNNLYCKYSLLTDGWHSLGWMMGAHSSLRHVWFGIVWVEVCLHMEFWYVSVVTLVGNRNRDECFSDQTNHSSKAERCWWYFLATRQLPTLNCFTEHQVGKFWLTANSLCWRCSLSWSVSS